MQISLININEIKQAHRFDAEYFSPENNLIRKKLNKSNFLIDLIIEKPQYGTTPKGGIFSEDGINFIRSQDFNYCFIEEIKQYCSKSFHLENKKSEVLNNDILIASVGATIGECAIYVNKLPANINQNIARIRVENKKISPFYLIIFMQTKYGQIQLKGLNTGNAQSYLNTDKLNQLKIFNCNLIFQTQIESLVKQAHAKQEQSKQLYKEAEKILLQELDLLNYVPQNNLIFSTTKKHIEKIKRFDAEYFQPKYKKIIEKIELYKGGVEQIKNIVKWEKGVEVGADCYVEKGFDFVRVSDFNKYGINEIEKKISDKTYHEFKEKFEPKIGDILFTKDGTIGMSYVLKENIQGLLSGAFLRLTLKKEYKDFEKESLVLILNSIVCKMQVEQLSGGALIAHLKPSDFETFKIPLIKKEIQTNIAEKIKLSFSLKKESKELLEKAKKLVEIEIEK